MHFALLTLATAVLASGAAIHSQLATRAPGLCNLAGNPSTRIGGNGGGTFCETHWPSADFIVGMRTWSSGNMIRAIEVRYSSGQVVKIGGDSTAKPDAVMALAPGERITAAWMTGNGIGTRLGSIHLETSAGTKLDFGKVPDSVKKWDIPFGSGYLIGVEGGAGLEIDNLGLIFLAGKVDKVELTGFRFTDDINKFSPQMKPQALDRKHYWNGLPNKMNVDFIGGAEQTNTNTMQQSSTFSFGVDTKLEAKFSIPQIAEYTFGTTVSLSTSEEYMQSQTTSKKVNQGYKATPELAPNTGADCEAYAVDGVADFPYTVNVILHMAGGATVKYAENGILHSVLYSETDVRCTPAKEDKIPPGFTAGKVVAATAQNGQTGPPQKLTQLLQKVKAPA